jgi:hypothetical protein
MKNLIKKILKEEFDSENFEWAEENGITSAEEFLYNKFKECELYKIRSRAWNGWMRYVDKKGNILFIDNIDVDKENSILYFNYHEIELVLKEMGLNYDEIQKLCIDMLYETHNRKVSTAKRKLEIQSLWIYETHKRRVVKVIH